MHDPNTHMAELRDLVWGDGLNGRQKGDKIAQHLTMEATSGLADSRRKTVQSVDVKSFKWVIWSVYFKCERTNNTNFLKMVSIIAAFVIAWVMGKKCVSL